MSETDKLMEIQKECASIISELKNMELYGCAEEVGRVFSHIEDILQFNWGDEE